MPFVPSSTSIPVSFLARLDQLSTWKGRNDTRDGCLVGALTNLLPAPNQMRPPLRMAPIIGSCPSQCGKEPPRDACSFPTAPSSPRQTLIILIILIILRLPARLLHPPRPARGRTLPIPSQPTACYLHLHLLLPYPSSTTFSITRNS